MTDNQTTPTQLSIYDDPDLEPVDLSKDDIRLSEVGDRAEGRIIRMEKIQTKFGPCPKFFIYDEKMQRERSFLAGAQDLWRQLHQLRPNVGDTVIISLVRIDGRKHTYAVEVLPEEEF